MKFTLYHGLINYRDTIAKCRYLKKLACKGTLRQVFIRVYTYRLGGRGQGVTKRCRLSGLTNSALVYEPKWGGGACGAANEYSCALGDLTPCLTYACSSAEVPHKSRFCLQSAELTREPHSFIGGVHISARALHVLYLILFGYISRLSQRGEGVISSFK